MAHCKQFHYSESETRSTLSNHWLDHCCSLKQRGCFHNSKVWCLCVCVCIGVYIRMQAQNDSVRLVSCAAAFIFRKAVTLLFVPNRISSRNRLFQSLWVSALLTVLNQGDVYDGNKALCVAQCTQQPIRVCPAEHLQHVTFVETELAWLCGNMMA